jgi:hypothetical protein
VREPDIAVELRALEVLEEHAGHIAIMRRRYVRLQSA